MQIDQTNRVQEQCKHGDDWVRYVRIDGIAYDCTTYSPIAADRVREFDQPAHTELRQGRGKIIRGGKEIQMQHGYLTEEQTTAELGIDTGKLRELVHEGTVKAIPVAPIWRISITETRRVKRLLRKGGEAG